MTCLGSTEQEQLGEERVYVATLLHDSLALEEVRAETQTGQDLEAGADAEVVENWFAFFVF